MIGSMKDGGCHYILGVSWLMIDWKCTVSLGGVEKQMSRSLFQYLVEVHDISIPCAIFQLASASLLSTNLSPSVSTFSISITFSVATHSFEHSQCLLFSIHPWACFVTILSTEEYYHFSPSISLFACFSFAMGRFSTMLRSTEKYFCTW